MSVFISVKFNTETSRQFFPLGKYEHINTLLKFNPDLNPEVLATPPPCTDIGSATHKFSPCGSGSQFFMGICGFENLWVFVGFSWVFMVFFVAHKIFYGFLWVLKTGITRFKNSCLFLKLLKIFKC